ncbi:MAG: glycosyltransferase family 4 protein [Thermoguttaceae bacterium]
MPEILLLCEYPTLNGGERSMLSTFDGLHAAGFAPRVMAPPDGPLADELGRRGVDLFPFCCRTDQGERKPLAQLREELVAAVRRCRPALLHANSLAMSRLSGPVAVELGLPSIGHLRDIVTLSAQAVADLNCHRRLLAVSEATRAFHLARGLSAEKTHVLYNGVDLDTFRPRQPTGYLHRELGLSPDVQLVGTIGQLGLRKGQDVLLHAAATIADRFPNAHYLLVGERNSGKDESRQFEQRLREVADSQLAGHVRFLGRRIDVPSLLGELTLLVHPARQEPLGRVLLEAAASGVPIVATAVGGTAEVFPSGGGSARLIPPDDPAALAVAMIELLADEPLRGELSSAARRRAEDRFDVRRAVAGLIAHYEAVLAYQ